MSVVVGLDVSGKVINLSQLRAEFDAASVAVPHGLTIQGPDQPTGTPPDIHLPSGSRLFTYNEQHVPSDLPSGAQVVVDAHVAMRDKTDAELAAEFQDPNTSPARRQEIRDMQSGLLPREQVPVA